MSSRRRRYPRAESCFVCGASYQARSGRHVLCGAWNCRKERRRWRDRLSEPESPTALLAFNDGRSARRNCLELSANPYRGEAEEREVSPELRALLRRYWIAGWRAELAEQARAVKIPSAPLAGVVFREPRSATIPLPGRTPTGAR